MAVLIKNIPMYHSNQLLKNIKHAIVVITDGINTPQNYFVITKKTALQYTLKKKKYPDCAEIHHALVLLPHVKLTIRTTAKSTGYGRFRLV